MPCRVQSVNFAVMNFVRKRFSFVIAMAKFAVLKSHNVTGSALMFKRSVAYRRIFCKFKVDFLTNIITVSILADIPRRFARNPRTRSYGVTVPLTSRCYRYSGIEGYCRYDNWWVIWAGRTRLLLSIASR